MRPEPGLRDLLGVAMEGAYRAGRRTMAYFNAGVAVETKADETPVTIADREAERVFREYVGALYPDYAVLGEEEGEKASDSPYRWIVDPIDGTKAFIAGVPLFGTLVGLELRGEPWVGVIYLPALDEMIAAANGLGCTWNGRPCAVSSVSDLKQAAVVTSSILRCQERSDAFDRLAATTRIQRTWGDAFGYALVATGRAEVMLDPVISPWDVAPMLPILREAGGSFTDWKGNPTIHGGDGVATNAALAEPVREFLRTERRRD